MAKSPTRSSRVNGGRKTTNKVKSKAKKVAVIGSGWYGKEVALALRKNGHKVVVFEKGRRLASGTSVKYSSRTHPSGLHYLRAPEHVVGYLQEHYAEFVETRGKYLSANDNAVHAIIAGVDANGNPSRTTAEQFKERYAIDPTARPVALKDFGLQNVQEPVAIREERIIGGEELREEFRLDLLDAGVEFLCDTAVESIQSHGDDFTVDARSSSSDANVVTSRFDAVVNATGFQQFTDSFKDSSLNVEVVYQAAVGLLYRDKHAADKENFSLLFLDGANPCLMQCGDDQYILTHGKYTLLASKKTPEEAHQALKNAEEINLIETKVRQDAEADLLRYYPDFLDRFEYVGYNSGVIAKILSETEMRIGYGIKSSDNIVHAMLGKISNAPAVARECVRLVEEDNLSSVNGVRFPKDGIFESCKKHFTEKPKYKGQHYACLMNPYPELENKENHYSNGNSNILWHRVDGDRRLQRANKQTNSIKGPVTGERRLRSDSLTSSISHSISKIGFNI